MSSRSNYTYQGPRKDLRCNVCDRELTRKDHDTEQLWSREVGEQYRVCSDCGFLLKTSLLKAREPPRTPLVRGSPRSYQIRFRNSSGTVPVEYRFAEKTPVFTPMPRTKGDDRVLSCRRVWIGHA
jgi:C4-type Zn-finger protein